MKTTLNLLIAVLFSASVMGQTIDYKLRFQERENLKEVKGLHNLLLSENKPEKHHSVNHTKNKEFLLKSGKAIKQRLDSVITQDWSGSQPNKGVEFFLYDVNGKTTLDAYFTWNSLTNQWDNSSKSEYIYDNNGNIILEVDYNWNANTYQWVGTYKYEYTYDANENLILKMYYQWDTNLGQWVGDYKDENTYNANGKMILQIEYYWTNSMNQWVSAGKAEYTYNTDEKLILKLFYNWNSLTNQWDSSSKIDYTLDINGNIIVETSYQWNTNTAQWDGYSKYEYTYDANEKMILRIEYTWNFSSGEWTGNYKDEYTYNANENMILEINYSWNFNTGQWISGWKEECAYDNTYTFNDLLIPYAFETDDNSVMFFNHMLTEMFDYQYISTNWSLANKSTFYYSAQNVQSISNTDVASAISVYPNPATDYVVFNLGETKNQFTLELFDIQGRVVMNQKVNNCTTVSVEKLQRGLYFYRIKDSGKIFNGKLMVD